MRRGGQTALTCHGVIVLCVSQFRVRVVPGAACIDCPNAFPPVITIGVGHYRCEFTPVRAGPYIVLIVVGRGGEEHQVGLRRRVQEGGSRGWERAKGFPGRGCRSAPKW